MKLYKRRNGSQRCSAPEVLSWWPSTDQGGVPHLTFRDAKGNWLWIEFDTDAEARELMSRAHLVFHNR